MADIRLIFLLIEAKASGLLLPEAKASGSVGACFQKVKTFLRNLPEADNLTSDNLKICLKLLPHPHQIKHKSIFQSNFLVALKTTR